MQKATRKSKKRCEAMCRYSRMSFIRRAREDSCSLARSSHDDEKIEAVSVINRQCNFIKFDEPSIQR